MEVHFGPPFIQADLISSATTACSLPLPPLPSLPSPPLPPQPLSPLPSPSPSLPQPSLRPDPHPSRRAAPEMPLCLQRAAGWGFLLLVVGWVGLKSCRSFSSCARPPVSSNLPPPSPPVKGYTSYKMPFGPAGRLRWCGSAIECLRHRSRRRKKNPPRCGSK